mgnify:CR=1 FL=1
MPLKRLFNGVNPMGYQRHFVVSGEKLVIFRMIKTTNRTILMFFPTGIRKTRVENGWFFIWFRQNRKQFLLLKFEVKIRELLNPNRSLDRGMGYYVMK